MPGAPSPMPADRMCCRMASEGPSGWPATAARSQAVELRAAPGEGTGPAVG